MGSAGKPAPTKIDLIDIDHANTHPAGVLPRPPRIEPAHDARQFRRCNAVL